MPVCATTAEDFAQASSLYDASVMLKTAYPVHRPVHGEAEKGQRCGAKRCADAQPIRIIAQVCLRRRGRKETDEWRYPSIN